ncbi:nitroreductase [Actinoplanes hulinensis]|uniref:Nitroreductase n=1 Tax=Actinoplanes hulinensis TaxID=1144547 RepID=A0ABS7BAB3_9ACTN|nr:nitroreductase [Actinoplanes hulinensis]MBW6437213.1 nitroreductase [Actinoplanes hulinensis]
MTSRTAVLAHAARLARHAPSILNTQPWQWHIGRHTAELRPDTTRALPYLDPDHHLMLLSCGAALHHATVAIQAQGRQVTVEHGTDPLARLTLGPPDTPRHTDLAAAITHRRTDRRAFGSQTPGDEIIADLCKAVAAQGLHLRPVRRDELPLLATATSRAASDAAHRPGLRAEVATWTDRPTGYGDGIPTATTATATLRRVPMRDFAPGSGGGFSVSAAASDIGARYVVLHSDDPDDWLRAGAALSALLLTATVRGVACSPMSELVEAPWPRSILATLIGTTGHPYLVVRLGYPVDDGPPPAAPRRPETETTHYGFTDASPHPRLTDASPRP